jgi:hypothetical protein
MKIITMSECIMAFILRFSTTLSAYVKARQATDMAARGRNNALQQLFELLSQYAPSSSQALLVISIGSLVVTREKITVLHLIFQTMRGKS